MAVDVEIERNALENACERLVVGILADDERARFKVRDVQRIRPLPSWPSKSGISSFPCYHPCEEAGRAGYRASDVVVQFNTVYGEKGFWEIARGLCLRCGTLYLDWKYVPFTKDEIERREWSRDLRRRQDAEAGKNERIGSLVRGIMSEVLHA